MRTRLFKRKDKRFDVLMTPTESGEPGAHVAKAIRAEALAKCMADWRVGEKPDGRPELEAEPS